MCGRYITAVCLTCARAAAIRCYARVADGPPYSSRRLRLPAIVCFCFPSWGYTERGITSELNGQELEPQKPQNLRTWPGARSQVANAKILCSRRGDTYPKDTSHEVIFLRMLFRPD